MSHIMRVHTETKCMESRSYSWMQRVFVQQN